jgi:hypothetical protein
MAMQDLGRPGGDSWGPSGHKGGDIMIALMIGITAMLRFFELAIGLFALDKPPPSGGGSRHT